jgi:DNA-binding NarL/FixJ family response regulator
VAEYKTPVVIAEELALSREGLSLLIDSTGRYAVMAATGNGEEALSLIEEWKPRIAVLDLGLPRLYAFEIARLILDAGLPTSVILLSVRGDRRTAAEAFRNGVSGFVLKSEPSQQLIDALDCVGAGGVYASPSIGPLTNGEAHDAEAPPDVVEALSPRELQVFSMMVEGVRAKEIAARLRLSPKTVDTYRSNMMRKLDIHDLAGLVKFALKHDLTVQA